MTERILPCGCKDVVLDSGTSYWVPCETHMYRVNVVETWIRMPSGVTSLEVKTFDGELIWETEYAVGKCPLANWPPGA